MDGGLTDEQTDGWKEGGMRICDGMGGWTNEHMDVCMNGLWKDRRSFQIVFVNYNGEVIEEEHHLV